MAKSILNAEDRQRFSEFPKVIDDYALLRHFTLATDDHEAIARIINFYDQLPIVQLWGQGVWSSADGQLVPAPVRTLYSRLHPRAPKGKRVLNLFTYVYDRLMPYWGRVIETTAHESAYEIDGLLLRPIFIRRNRLWIRRVIRIVSLG
jgi:TnpA family transposase